MRRGTAIQRGTGLGLSLSATAASPVVGTDGSAAHAQQSNPGVEGSANVRRLDFEGALGRLARQIAGLTSALEELRQEHRAELLEATRSLHERNKKLAMRLTEAVGDSSGLSLQELVGEEVTLSFLSAPLRYGSPSWMSGMDGSDSGRATAPGSPWDGNLSAIVPSQGVSAPPKAAIKPALRRTSISLDEGGGKRPMLRRASTMHDGEVFFKPSRQSDNDAAGNKEVELAKIWEKKRGRDLGAVVRRRSAAGGEQDGRFAFDVFAKANFSNVISRSRFTDELSNTVLQKLVMEPTSRFSMVWNVGELLLLSFDLVAIPVIVVNMNPPVTILSKGMQWFSVIFWTADVPISFFKGFVTKTGDLEMRLGYIAGHYIKSRLLYDLLLVVIEWVNFIFSTGAGGDLASSGRLLRFLRFTRLLKVSKMQRLMQSLVQRIRSNVALAILDMSKVVFFILLLNHMVSCGFFAVEDHEVRDIDTFGERYFVCLLWALTQLGFGTSPIMPNAFPEMFYAAAVSVVSMMMFCFLVGSVVTGMTRLQMLIKVRREQEEQLRDYLCRHKVSWPLRNRIWIFLRKTHKTEKTHVLECNVELLQKMPKAVTSELRAEVFIPILTVHPFFGTYAVSRAEKAAMHALVGKYEILKHNGDNKCAVDELALAAEHELFQEGDSAESMYFVVQGVLIYHQAESESRGRIQNFRGNEVVLQTPTDKDLLTDSRKALKVNLEDKPGGDQWDNDGTMRVHPGEWLCEEALWLKWTHAGSAVATMQCEVVSLVAEKFQAIMHAKLPEARKYAHLFFKYAQEQKEHMNDLYMDITRLRSMAHEIFEPPIQFDVSACAPVESATSGRNDWRPNNRRLYQRMWATPWKDDHQLNRSALLATMTTDMKNDIIMVYNTLFSSQHYEILAHQIWMAEEEKHMHNVRIQCLKRLFLCFATCRLYWASENNGSRTQPWPYPLASSLCHGSRVLLRITGVPWRDFLNFLLFGDEHKWDWEESGVPAPLYVRRAASHGVRMNPQTAELQESKLKNLQAFGNNHLGMDIPVGGLGNPAPNGQLFVGPGGVPYRKTKKSEPDIIKEIQHGHLYIRWDDFGSKTAPLLKEREAPSGDAMAVRGSAANFPSSDRSTTTEKVSTQGTKARYNREVETYQPVPNIRSIDDLMQIVKSCADDDEVSSANSSSLVETEEYAVKLLSLMVKLQELRLEKSCSGRLRCTGKLVSVVVELVADDDESRGRILLHQHASTGTEESANDDMQESTSKTPLDVVELDGEDTVEDVRVLTVLCCHHESWNVALSRYCRDAFSFNAEAMEKFMSCCVEEDDEAFTFQTSAPPSLCHHHQAICDKLNIDLMYNAVRLKVRMYESDCHLLGSFTDPEFMTHDASMELQGFAGNQKSDIGEIRRVWVWLPSREVMSMENIAGLRPSPDSIPLQLLRQTRTVCSLLMGIEGSAPLKDDLFGSSHGVDAKSKDRSAFGKPKWRSYGKGGQEVPADLGGMRVNINKQQYEFFKDVCKTVGCKAPTELAKDEVGDENAEFEFFRKLLQECDAECEKLISDVMGMGTMKEPTGVFDVGD